MAKKPSYQKKADSGFALKVFVPVVLALLVIGFIFWSSDEGNSDKIKSKHEMADGVAKFYATFRKSFMPGATQLDEYTIELPAPDKSLTEKLQQRGAQTNPAKANWQGEKKKRSFKANDTIKNALENFGKQEDVEVIWDLKYDYIVKNQFGDSGTFKRLVNTVTKSVNNDYDGLAKAYFCPQERAVVITASENKYVSEFCHDTTSRRRQALDKKREKDYQLRKQLGLN